MKKPIALLFFVFVVGCIPNEQKNQIIVDGEASLEFAPDNFTLSATLRSRKETQAAALAEIAERLSEIRETLPNLEGLTHLKIDASTIELEPVQNAECTEKASYGREVQCPIEGYYGSISLLVKASPASESGRTLSMVSQLGAESVSLSSYSLDDMEAAQKAALDAAVRDAKVRVQNIAGAAGAVISGPIRIQYGEGFGDRRYATSLYEQQMDQIVVTGSRIAYPEIDLDLDPQPIKVTAKVVAAFEID